MAPPSPASAWPKRNVVCVAVFGPVLIVTGVLGLVLPPERSLMSGAVPYDLFHIAFGLLGTAIALSRSGRAAALFNAGFGLIDLWQALAGPLGLFPAHLFGLRPADHLVHVVLGLALVGIGGAGLRTREAQPGPGSVPGPATKPFPAGE